MGRFLWVGILAALAIAPGACGGSTALGTGGSGGSDGGAGTGGGAGYNDCSLSKDCLVRAASCCGTCGAATRGDAVGINRSRAGAYNQEKCAGVGCPACYMEQDPTLVAACVSQHCGVIDVQDSDATACTSDSDCRIRTTSCCECGGEVDRAHIIAVSNEARFTSFVCEGVGACPECAPVYPSNVVAHCGDNHHCTAEWQTP